MDGSICHWQLETGTLLREIAGNGLPATAVAFLPGDQRIISAGLDGGVRICDLRSGREEWRGEFGKLGISALALAPDGKIAAWGGYDHRIVIWDVELKEKRFEITIPATVVSQLKFSRDGTTLAIAGRERTIRLYDTQTWSEKEGIPVGPPLH
jgi:WD40 repeat protein